MFELIPPVAVALFLLARVGPARVRLRNPVKTFGDEAKLSPEMRRAMFKQYLKQQAWAFGLLVAAIILGFVFATVLFVKLLVDASVGVEEAIKIAVTLGDVWLGKYALDAYREASKRVEELVPK